MHKLNVLFLCTGNSARSQMAEALLRKYAGDRFNVYSAGTDPKGVNTLTVKVLDEIGLSTDALRSKDVREYLGELPIRYLIIVCGEADKSCPTIAPAMMERLLWPFDDPAAATGDEEERLEKFREVRNEIAAKIKNWLTELG